MLSDILKKVVFLFLLFIYIYGPPFAFFSFSSDKLVHLLFFFSLFFYPDKYARLFKYPIFSLTVVVQIIVSVYTLILYLFTPTEYNYILHNLLLLTEVLVSSMFFVVLYLEWFQKQDADTYNFLLYSIIIITVVQSLISIVGFVNPKLNIYINNVVLFYQKTYNFGINYRGFGMSDDYFFTMPVVQGIGIVCCLYFAFQEKYFYLLFVPFLLLSISFNARIGFTPVVIFVLLSVIFFFKKSEIKIRAILAFIVLIGLFIIYFNPDVLWKSKLEKGVSFGYSFFDVTAKFLFSNRNDETANYSVLREMVFLPDNNQILFGSGESIFYSNNKNSDVGYINQIFYGGITYLILQFSVLFIAFYQTFKSLKFNFENLKIKVFIVVAFLTFLICNIKGYFFLVKPGLRLVFLIFFIVYYTSVNMKNYNDRKV
ncbi:MAG: hypothetical protein NT004_14645 [Bacteroidetes bacterium]|nr:hypothetical protein [Bacteroidota bacterium]